LVLSGYRLGTQQLTLCVVFMGLTQQGSIEDKILLILCYVMEPFMKIWLCGMFILQYLADLGHFAMKNPCIG
jgi:hypothetical protein